jgi:hypothetical protein
VPADLTDHVDDPLPNLLGDLLKLVVAQLLEIFGPTDRGQQRSVLFAHDCRL